MAPSTASPGPRPHPHLYEINTWLWLTELSKREGRPIVLGDVPDREWDGLQGKGFDVIWLMGIWERSPRGRDIAANLPDLQKDYDRTLPGWNRSMVVGSPYAVHAYCPDPHLASWEQLAEVLSKLHDRGMKLILDFVPNHTAVDHEWVTNHPEYYVQWSPEEGKDPPSGFFSIDTQEGIRVLAHGKDPNFPAWTDTAQLNYSNPAARSALLQELQKIARYCDGVRCDMAMLVLNEVFASTWRAYLSNGPNPSQEFWNEAIALLPAFLWIAEVYWDREWELQQLGFQFTYDKRLYDRLRQGSPRGVADHLTASVSYQNKLVRFLENHDEGRSATVFGNVRLPAVAVLTSTLPGMRLYHQGQLEGKRVRVPVQLAQAQHEPIDTETLILYERLLRIADQGIFHDGNWQLLPIQSTEGSSHENLLAYLWENFLTHVIVVVNLGSVVAQGRIPLRSVLRDVSSSAYILRDELTAQVSRRHRTELEQEGLVVRLDPFGAHIFFVAPETSHEGP